MIPYGRQDISEDDIAAVETVLRSDFLTQGPAVPAFEDAIAQYCGVRFAVATNSATSALHIACLALDVGPGDRVWTSPITFVASSNAALYCGAQVDFVDIDPHTFNLCPKRLAEKLAQADAAGQLPKVIIPVHLGGQPCDMAAIRDLADRHRVKVIEDASHAIGALYGGKPIGACQFSDIAVFSFHPVKIVTTGEGGMTLTNDSALAERMQLDRSHGITRDSGLMQGHPDGPWYYEQLRLGFNYRMTDIAAALGLSQLERLTEFVERRRAIAAAYNDAFAGLPITGQWQHPDALSAWHLYLIRVRADRHRAIFDALQHDGIGVNLHYRPVYLQPYYRALGFRPGLCPHAEDYYGQAISLPIFPRLDNAEQAAVVAAVRRAASQ